jgi:hypothetical protein
MFNILFIIVDEVIPGTKFSTRLHVQCEVNSIHCEREVPYCIPVAATWVTVLLFTPKCAQDLRFGMCHGRCSRAMTRGLEMCVLDDVNTCSVDSSGCESFPDVRCTEFTYGDYLWGLSLGQRTGDGKFDGEAFWVGCGWFFSGWVEQWRYHCSMSSDHHGRYPRVSRTWEDTCDVRVSTS